MYSTTVKRTCSVKNLSSGFYHYPSFQVVSCMGIFTSTVAGKNYLSEKKTEIIFVQKVKPKKKEFISLVKLTDA